MSPELLAILLTSLAELAAIVVLGMYLSRQLRETTRIQKALAGLVIQESEKIQTFLREAN